MKKHIAIFFLFVLSACELIVDVDVPFEHAQLTVNSLFHPDSAWMATVSINRHILDELPITRIENAEVIIYDTTLPVDTLIHQGNGNYRSDENPEVGKRYEIRVSAPGYEAVSSTSVIPLPTSISFFEKQHTSVEGQTETRIQLKFKDDHTQQNFYQIFIDAEVMSYNADTGETDHYTYRVFLDNGTSDGSPYQQYLLIDNSIFLKDILFNGKEAEISLKSKDFALVQASRINVTVRTLTPEYYNHVTTADLQRITSGDPFAQPVNVYNNIIHGFGIFAGSSQSTMSYTNPRPAIREISPIQGKVGDLITILVENIVDPNAMSIFFRGSDNFRLYAPIVAQNGNELKVVVPEKAITGKIIINVRGVSIASDQEFVVVQ
jgi:hypothetical protein